MNETEQKKDDMEQLNIAVTGPKTFADIRETVAGIVALVEAVSEAVSPEVKASDAWSIPAITVYDGDTYNKEAPWAEPCVDECTLSAPVFFECPAPLIFICRGCAQKVCWRHSFTDKTGGWCSHCAPAA